MSGESNPMLAALAAVYGEPDSSDPKAFLGMYSRLMRQYARSECEEAADLLLSRRKKYKTWPVPADCIEVLEEVRKAKRIAMQAASMAERIADPAVPKPGHFQEKKLSAREQRELEKWVDDCAAGKIDMGLCAPALRRMAQTMRDRRRARA